MPLNQGRLPGQILDVLREDKGVIERLESDLSNHLLANDEVVGEWRLQYAEVKEVRTHIVVAKRIVVSYQLSQCP